MEHIEGNFVDMSACHINDRHSRNGSSSPCVGDMYVVLKHNVQTNIIAISGVYGYEVLL